jgi:glycosyl transferase family 25
VLPIFIINLPQSIERRRRIEEQSRALGLDCEFVAARDGDSLSPEEDAIAGVMQPHLGRPLTRHEIGCLLSHIGVWSRIERERIPAACVLEDDCVLSREFAALVRELDGVPSAWDALLLGHHSARHDATEGAETCFRGLRAGGRRIARVAEFPMGAYAYVITEQGARRLARYAEPLRMPADWVTGYSPVAGVRLFAITPPCVTTEEGRSTIAGRDLGAGGRRDPLVRGAVGKIRLLARKLGVNPAGYVRRF